MSFKCNLVIPGVAKSGTSSLHSYLETHPEICMAPCKEPHFFSVDGNWGKGENFHNNLFEESNKGASIFGESSTTYFISETALKRISNSLHAPKVIIVLREPVSRTISHYRWLYALGLETRPLLDAIGESGYGFDPNRSINGNYMAYIEFSSYRKWVSKWQQEFGNDNVLLLNSEDLRCRTNQVLDKCSNFLGVKQIDWSLAGEKNRTEDILMRSESSVSRLAKSMLPTGLKEKLREHAPSLVRKWNNMFIADIKRPATQISDRDLKEVQALLSDDHDYYCELFTRAS